MEAKAVNTLNKSADHRREQLISATIEAISRYGLSKTTISKVADIASMSQGIVNFYFKSKDHLLLDTLKHVSEEYSLALEQAYSSSSDSLSVLNAIIKVSFDKKLCNPENVVVWYAFWSESQARKDYLTICSKDDSRFRNKLIELFSALLTTQSLSKLNPVAIARGFEGLIDDFWQEYLISPKNFDHELAKRTCQDYLLAFTSEPLVDKDNPKDCIGTQTDQSDLLSPWTYHNEEFFQLEKNLIFKKNWLLVGHLSDVPNIGDYLTFDAVGERALIIRSDKNEINAFHNVCRHRGAKVVENEQGNCPRALVCPFHGWSYHLDGTVRHIPRQETFSGIDKKDNGLVKLPIEIWQGFIFINFTPGCQSLADRLAGVVDKFAPYQLESLEPLPGTKYCQQRPYNWKIIHDIDNEGYHVPIGHPSLQQLYGQNYSDTIQGDIPISYGYINDKPGKLWSVRHYQKILPRFDHLPDENQRLWLYVGIFPSMVIGFYPDMVEFYMSLPKTTSSSEYIGGAYALPDNRREVKLSRYLTQRINESTEQEDESFVQWIQQGIHSSVFPELQLSSLEHGVRHLHQQIQQRIPVAKLMNQPETGLVSELNESMTHSL